MTKFLIAVKFYCNQSTGGEGLNFHVERLKIEVGGLTTEVDGLSPRVPPHFNHWDRGNIVVICY